MKSRVITIFIFILALWGLLIVRGAYLQILPNPKLEELIEKQFVSKVKLPGQRGRILDRHGKELAVSIPAYSLFADPAIIEEPHLRARQLAKILEVPHQGLLKKLKKKKRRFLWLKRRMTLEDKRRVLALKERGLGFIEESRRVYPNEGVLAQLLGFVGSSGSGLEGLERVLNGRLKGKEKEFRVRRDARGRPLAFGDEALFQNLDGQDVFLTVDRDIQYVLEKELQEAVNKYEADSAVGVVLAAKTSEILALANVPTFDANVGSSIVGELRRNRALTDAFEPGSTMKTFTVAAALRQGVLTPNKKYFCEDGSFRIGRRIIREADSRHQFGWLTASEILAFSSNIGSTKIAMDVGDQYFAKTLQDFGFGAKTGVRLLGESKGILNPLPWRPHLLSNISFGHGIAVTALQLANAYAVIANGGVFRSPQILHRVQNSLAQEVPFQREITERRVLDPKQAATLTLMLSTATSDGGGTGANARVAGFPVAGKTGTAQKVNPSGRGYMPGAYISSFSGYLPAQSPEFVIYIAVDNPKKAYYGSQVAAPVFAKVASFAIRRARLSPVMIADKHFLKKKTRNERKTVRKKVSDELLQFVPDIRGLTLREVYQQLGDQDLDIHPVGGGTVSNTFPPPGFTIPKNREIDVYFDSI